MTRWTRAAVVALAAGGAGASGCHSLGSSDRPGIDDRYAKYVDPSYPERYNYTARQEVLAPFAVMVGNAQVLDHTIFNYHFEVGTDTLTPGGLEKVTHMVRQRPAPDARVYLQTAHDITYDPTAPEKFVNSRQELDVKRAQAVQRYLQSLTANRPMNFDVQVIDPDPNQIRAELVAGASRALRQQYTATAGGVGGGGAGLQGAGGGAVGGAAAGGGGAGGGQGSY